MAKQKRPGGHSILEPRSDGALEPDAQVLVVDDETIIRQLLSDFLKAKGYDVASVGSGEEALQWLREHRPSLVLLDIFMPNVNGLEVMRELKRTQPELCVLVLSGYVDEDLEQQVKLLGACNCLPKPFDIHKLYALISSCLEKTGH
ncbi:MAG: response regulator [Acidobacteriota bacterium]